MEPMCLIWVIGGGWWSQHRRDPRALQEEGAQLTLQQTRPRVVPSSQPVPGPLGGFQVMATSTLILFSPLVPDALPFLLLFKSKATSRPRQDPVTARFSMLTTELYCSDFGPGGDHVVCMVVLFPYPCSSLEII